ncbi:MAG: arsenic transporter [Clostridiales bacterium]|nr:arsenic transporter [Clostridiales bacterium]
MRDFIAQNAIWITLAIFALTYVLLISLPKHRTTIALCSAAVFVVLGIMPLKDVFWAIEWNVLLMIAGTMGIVSLVIASGMPALLADIIIEKTPNVKWAIIALSLFSGLISAFVDNVATVLMVAPVALNICKKLDISPVKSIVAIAISSNLQGAATLVGDTTSILLAGYAGMNFLDFFWHSETGTIGIFFIVEAAAIAATAMLLFVFRKESAPIIAGERSAVKDYFPTALILAMLVLLIVSSFIPNPNNIPVNGIICVGLMVIGVAVQSIRKKSFAPVKETLKEIDYKTLLLLFGLFIVVGSIERAGLIDAISKIIERAGGGSIIAIYSLIVWASVIISAFIDNIPYVLTMLPVAKSLAATFAINPILFYLGLLSGATLGGNLTPIGASANIAGLGILRKNGYEVGAGEFMRISVPFTLIAVGVGYALILIFYGLTVIL